MDLEPVVWAFRGALGDRLLGLAAYGSVVTDDAIPDFSDLDVWVLLSTPLTLDDGLMLQRKMPALDSVPYVQPAYRLISTVEPHLVPDAFRVLTGSVPVGAIHDEATLRSSGEEVLERLSGLVEDDLRAWTGAIAEKRARHVRLMTTRLKPAVRATLVRAGEPVLVTWRLPWDELVTRWRRHDEARAEALDTVVRRITERPRDDRAAGEAVLRLLADLSDLADRRD